MPVEELELGIVRTTQGIKICDSSEVEVGTSYTYLHAIVKSLADTCSVVTRIADMKRSISSHFPRQFVTANSDDTSLALVSLLIRTLQPHG